MLESQVNTVSDQAVDTSTNEGPSAGDGWDSFFSELGQAAEDLGRTTKRWRCRSLAGSGHLVMDGLTQLTIPRDSS